MASPTEVVVDVFICGGGPVGLLIAYTLARMGISTYIVERYKKEEQDNYGRAATLYPRTNEMLDQLELMDELSQIGFIGRNSVTFKDGEKVVSRGWQIMLDRMQDTFFDFCLNIRQKCSEAVFRASYASLGGEVHAGWLLEQFEVDESSASPYKVTSTILEVGVGNRKVVKSKFIVGADGAHSTVRRIAEIPFTGESTPMHWCRIDGVLKTNMPDARVGFASIESPTHGNVLWVAQDHGRTRIGFALSPELYAKYGDNITKDQVRDEAIRAMAPFSIEFITIDWWTFYTIRQKVAETFRQGSVLLAGDACHTHSSGAAQGMNTGMHDAVNLGWKLGGVLKGWYEDIILDTYDQERRPAAHKLIELDKSIASLISGQRTKSGDPNVDVNELFNSVLDSSASFNLGLGVHYTENLLNRRSFSGGMIPGWRGPDVLLRRPGMRVPTRLYQITRNIGKYWILVFSGTPLHTRQKLAALRGYLDSDQSFTQTHINAFSFMTIVAGAFFQGEEALGVPPFGHVFYDVDLSAYVRYGVTVESGCIVCLRPDGTFAFATGLDKCSEVGDYFRTFVKKSSHQDGVNGNLVA